MALMSTCTSLTYHIIFSTKCRKPRIDDALKDDHEFLTILKRQTIDYDLK